MYKLLCTLIVVVLAVLPCRTGLAQTYSMSDYTAYPPFINQTVPPLVMIVMSKDHRMFIKGYNDLQDLDNNSSTGTNGVENTYADYVDYYGYFDPAKCYDYTGGRFVPVAVATTSGSFRYTCSTKWSGNFLNWATMSRIDIVRKVLYGGARALDNSGATTPTTTLVRSWIPQDAHSWAKGYTNAAGRPTVAQLTPKTGVDSITLCNTNSAVYGTQTVGQVWVVTGNYPSGYYPYAASTDNSGGGQCTKTADNGGSYSPAASDKYNVEVSVCVAGLLEANCDQYQSGATSWWKPTGLMQRMGLNRQGTPANTADDTVNMRFALISGSYGAHAAGGILRNKIVDLTSEIDSSLGTVKSTSKIIEAINAFRIRQYSFSTGWYDGGDGAGGDCNGSIRPAFPAQYTLSDDGNCISWGNPMGEMFYEAVRYFMGKTPNTSIFKQATPDSGYVTSPTTDPNYLPIQTWNASVDPYSYCPYCSKAFILTMSDAFPSYDSDHLPGAYGFTPAPTDPLTGDDTGFDVQSFLNAYPNAANSIQGLDGQSTVFVGQSGATYDKACTPKTGNFVSMRGLCPDEPTKQGSYYIAGLAYKANTTDLRASLTGDTANLKQNITTYAVVTNSPFPILEYTISGKKVQIVPSFHDDCPPTSSPVYSNTPAYTGCTSGNSYHVGSSDGSGGELVDFQVCDVNDESANGYEYCYDIMWDDAEYGWDYDLDVRYRIYVDVNPAGKLACNTIPQPSGCPNTSSSSFGNTPASGTIRIKTKGKYANAGHTDFAGYLINGVSTAVWTGASAQAEGEYYDIRCGGTAGGNDCDTYNINDSAVAPGSPNQMNDAIVVRDFLVNGSTADQLKDPFWYAAKYGGFKDLNGNNIPDNGSTSAPGPCTTTPGSTCEWDKNLDGIPDTYFYAANPLKLEQQLAKAFADILNRVSSGTAASVLASSTTGQGATYQSYFFASKLDGEREVTWVGYTQAVFVDVFGNLREDTNGDGKLIYTDDRIIVTRFDPTTSTVVVDKYNSNANGQATGAAVTTGASLSDVVSIWEAGSKLAQTPSSARNLWTWVDRNGDKKVSGSSELVPFNSANLAAISPYLRPDAVAPYTAGNIMEFIRGCDPTATGSTCPGLSALRDRKLVVGATPQVWKLGDPVNATPVIVGAPRDRFDVIYGDTGYQQFYQRWRDRRQVLYVGANDGMLHAFNVGYYQQEAPGIHHGCFTQNKTDNCATQTTVSLGNELWGFIPQELLPQLRWMADPAYTHVYYVDLKPKVVDARIFADDGPTGTHPGGWGTILIGGFRMGGSCGNCPAAGNGRDMHFSADFGNGVVEDRHFYSAYFVLDITDPDSNPKLLWSFSDPNLGLTTSSPGVANVKDSSGTQKWFALFGSGPTSYDAAVNQIAKLFIVDLANGPVTSPVVTVDASGGGTPPNSFMGDIVTVDRFLNFTDDVAYAGQVISGSPWQGKLLRLTTGCMTGSCQTNPSLWGAPGNVPSEVLYQFTDRTGATRTLGPIPTAPALSTDDSDNLWVFAGTGRYYTQGAGGDKTDTSQQYLFGVKDWVMQGGGGCTETNRTNCSLGFAPNDLVDTSLAQICIPGRGTCGTTTNQVTGVTVGGTTVNTFANLVSMVQSKKGWVAALGTSSTGGPSERVSAAASVLGGVVFFPTLTPSTDPCIAAGTSSEYALYYVTGSAYSSPVVGTSGTGNMVVNNKVDLGQGLATSVALHIGASGSGTGGGANTGGGCQSGVVGYVQSSTGTLNSFCGNIGGVTSRYISWNNQRL